MAAKSGSDVLAKYEFALTILVGTLTPLLAFWGQSKVPSEASEIAVRIYGCNRDTT